MGLFDRLFGNRGDSNQSFRGVCKRCHFSGLLDSEGYCSSCHDLKYRLERLTGGYVQDPQSYVDKQLNKGEGDSVHVVIRERE